MRTVLRACAAIARNVLLSHFATLSLCVLSGVALVPAYAQPTPPPVTYVQASNIACKVGRPNVMPGETVIYQGGCADGFAQGTGTAQWFMETKPTLRFEGTFAHGLLEGKGKMIGADGDRYEGDYKGGLRHGHGVYLSANGTRFEGEYVNNQRGAEGPVPPALATPTSPPPQMAQAPKPNAPAATPSTATPPAALMAKDGQNKTADQRGGSTPIPLPGHNTGNSKPNIYSVAAPWGGDIHMLCGPWPDGETVIPSNLDPRKSALSGKYPIANLPDDALFRFLVQVEQFVRKSCAEVGWTIAPHTKVPIYLLPEAPPAKYRVSRSSALVYAYHDDYTWQLTNFAADSYTRQQAEEKAAAARQKAEAERQVQEAERRRVAEQADKERRAVEKQRQDQVAAAQAEREKKIADHEKANKAQFMQFVKKHGLAEKEPKGLTANPFAFEGQKLLLISQFEQMQNATSGLFVMNEEGPIIVTDIPKGTFVAKNKVFLAGKIVGNVKFEGVVGGLLPVNGMVPSVKYLGALICLDQRCDEMQEK